MRKILPLLILILSSFSLRAQISVASFTLLDTDPDARIHAVLDEEEIPGALIKIVTTAKGLNYDIGQLPVIKVDENHVGEIWVYVPDGTMKMKISHSDLGSLRGPDVENGYFIFPQRLKRAKVYRMELTHQEVVKTVGPQIPVSLTFNCDVNGAEVILGEGANATSAGYISNNQLKIPWPKGQTVTYRVKKNRYEDFIGTYKVENDENSIDIKLKPLFGYVTVTTLPDASIYLNGNYVGKGSYNDNLDLGNYTVKVSREGYRDEQKTFNVASGDRKSIDINPNMIFGSLNITTTPSGADVYIDGKYIGKTPYNINQLMVGSHNLEIKKSGYEDWSKNLKIEEGKTTYENIKLSDYGRITISSNVYHSSVYVNERYVGTTPYNLSGPAGKYKVRVENGPQYSIYKKTIYLNADSKNMNANLYENYIKKKEFFFEIGYSQAKLSPNLGMGLGFYIKNFNFEFDFSLSLREGTFEEKDNDVNIMSIKLGYGLSRSHKFRITPQIGISMVEDWEKIGVCIPLSIRFNYAFSRWFGFYFTPTYQIPIKTAPSIVIGGNIGLYVSI